MEDATAPARFSVLLLAAFGGLALVLATIGMNGVVSYSVVQRTREIGVRVALGAGRGQVFAMVVGRGSRRAAAGIAIGLLAALGATRLLRGLLYGACSPPTPSPSRPWPLYSWPSPSSPAPYPPAAPRG